MSTIRKEEDMMWRAADEKAKRIAAKIELINSRLSAIEAEMEKSSPANNRKSALAAIASAIEIINSVVPGKLEAHVEGDYSEPPPTGDKEVTIYVRHIPSNKTLSNCWGVQVDGSENYPLYDKEVMVEAIYSGLIGMA
jgi:hypothetical protein